MSVCIYERESQRQRERESMSAGLPCASGLVVENLPANAGDMGLIPGLGRAHIPQATEPTKPVHHSY